MCVDDLIKKRRYGHSVRRVPLRDWSYAVRGMHRRLKCENTLEEKDVASKRWERTRNLHSDKRLCR